MRKAKNLNKLRAIFLSYNNKKAEKFFRPLMIDWAVARLLSARKRKAILYTSSYSRYLLLVLSGKL